MKKHKTLLMLSAFICLSLAFIIGGCSDDDDEVEPQVRVLHMSPDAPNVDVLIDNTIAIQNLAFRASSGYREVTSGTRNFKVVPTGQNSPVVINKDIGLSLFTSYTVIAVDVVQKIDAIFAADQRDPVDSKAKVRFIHAIPDAPALDIKVGSSTGPTLFANVSFKRITDYIEVAQGDYDIVATLAGDPNEFARFKVKFSNGQVYSVVANGTLDDNDAADAFLRIFTDNGAGTQFVDVSSDD